MTDSIHKILTDAINKIAEDHDIAITRVSVDWLSRTGEGRFLGNEIEFDARPMPKPYIPEPF